MSSPGAIGLRMPPGMPCLSDAPAPGRVGAPGRPLAVLPSRRIGLPTSSNVFPRATVETPGLPGRVGDPGRVGPF
ncbi:hypothetical protein CREGCYN_14770 [Synechococcus sp. M16CYN]